MLTAPQAGNTGYTDQNSVTVFVVGTVDVSSPWYTQAQSTHKRLPQGQSLGTYEAELDSDLSLPCYPTCLCVKGLHTNHQPPPALSSYLSAVQWSTMCSNAFAAEPAAGRIN